LIHFDSALLDHLFPNLDLKESGFIGFVELLKEVNEFVWILLIKGNLEELFILGIFLVAILCICLLFIRTEGSLCILVTIKIIGEI